MQCINNVLYANDSCLMVHTQKNIIQWERSTLKNGINQLTDIGICYFLTSC